MMDRPISTLERVDAFRGQIEIRYVRHDDAAGIAASMNDGVRHATGDLIAFLDHDDTWFPEFLETQLTYLEAHPEVGMVHSDFQTIDVRRARSSKGALLHAAVGGDRVAMCSESVSWTALSSATAC